MRSHNYRFHYENFYVPTNITAIIVPCVTTLYCIFLLNKWHQSLPEKCYERSIPNFCL